MKKQTVDKILQLNKEFYANVATDFSQTRQYAWRGWERVAQSIEKHLAQDTTHTPLKIADPGCGNGRFLSFLQRKHPKWNMSYVGWDTDKTLLETAHREAEANAVSLEISKYSYDFVEWDVLSNIATVKGKYNLVTAFGLTHHIPSREMRNNWFNGLFKLVDEPGLLVLTFWNYSKDKRSENAVRSIKTPTMEINENELETGDYFLGWDKKPNVFRFIHEYSDNEIENIVENAKKEGLTLIDTFDSDGRSQNLNKYCIFKK